METYENTTPQPLPSGHDLELTAEIKNYLSETAKWGKFLGIVGYVFVGLMVLTAFFAGFFFDNLAQSRMAENGGNPAISGMFSIMMAFYLILLALLYFFPSMYIHQFGVKTQLALRHHHQLDFVKAFSRLKSFFKFFGILTIILLAFYVLAIVMMLVTGAFLAGNQ